MRGRRSLCTGHYEEEGAKVYPHNEEEEEEVNVYGYTMMRRR